MRYAHPRPSENAARGSREMRKQKPTTVQRHWLGLGLDQPGGKLPLFYQDGRLVNVKTVQSCIREGWAKPWIRNPIKPDWLICKLTTAGRTEATLLKPHLSMIDERKRFWLGRAR